MTVELRSDILIVDDEADIRELVGGILEDEGHHARLASNSDQALKEIELRRPSLVFLDIWLQGSRLDGLEVLDLVKEQHPDLPVVMISGHGNIEMAVSAIRRGAYDFIEKPFKADRLVLVATRALETSKLRREVQDLRQRSGEGNRIVGSSFAIGQLNQTLERVGKTNSRVLISGPSGCGKELCARTLHACSNRAEGPFVVLNAASMDADRWESELFGHEDGSVGNRKIGALEEAHGGTLYIDEIADMPRETQGKILRVLVDQQFQRVGGSTRVHVDVRIVSSSSRDLEQEIHDGRLREDLFHRLSVVPIRVPGLAERREDIPELVRYFVDQIARSTGLPRRPVKDDAMAVLQSHDWPGNVRQLRNNVERMMILCGGKPDSEITADMLPAEVGSSLPPVPSGSGAERIMALPLREAREIFEREYLASQINRFGGNISRTADFVGMERSALHRKLKSLGVNSSEKTVEAG
jgi:two-component system nitrogen regulation response regulator NtrX